MALLTQIVDKLFSDEAAASDDYDLHCLMHMFLCCFLLVGNRKRFCFLCLRAMINSLGITFWYLVAGRTPFTGRTLEEIRARQSEELPLDQLKDVEIPVPVIGLLKSMLAIDPAARPHSARELLAAVQRCSKMEQEAPAVFEAAARREEGFWVAVLPFKFSGVNSEVAVSLKG